MPPITRRQFFQISAAFASYAMLPSLKMSPRLYDKLRDDPEFFAREILGVHLWSKQIEILESLRANKRTGVASGHGVGKTFASAVATLWWTITRPGAKVITTAPTGRNVRENLWGEIHKLYANARVPLGGEMLDLAYRCNRQGWGAVGICAANPDAFQGAHAEDILVIFDEAQGIDQGIWTAAESMISSDRGRLLAIANPIYTDGPLYDAFNDNRAQWRTMHISCLDHPNLKVHASAPPPFPGSVSPQFIDDMKEQWGEGSPLWMCRVLGQFPLGGENAIVPIQLLQHAAAMADEADKKNPSRPWLKGERHMGVDLGREGTDPSVATLSLGGRMVDFREWNSSDLMETADRIAQLQKRWELPEHLGGGVIEIPPHHVHIDEEGLGGGVVDRLYQLDLAVDGVKFGRAPEGDWEHVTGSEAEFRNRKAELCWAFRIALQQGLISVDRSLKKHWRQLSSQRYKFTSDGKVQVEAKDDVKSRLGRSPDHADSAVYALSRVGTGDLIAMRI